MNAPAAAAQDAETKFIVRDYLETILVCVVFVVFSRTFVFQQSKIPSGSMMNTLLVGDYIMVNRFVFAPTSFDWESGVLPIRTIRRGDIVVFKQPEEPEIDFIKRVIGLPGDLVELRDGRLYVNGHHVPEPYVEEQYRREDTRKNLAPTRVRPGHYFVLGDHRNQSADSRIWGQVPAQLMKGRALLIWWSYEEHGSKIYMTLPERLRSWGSKIVHFLPRSRWNRCFQLIR
jgi:signal peptidase I